MKYVIITLLALVLTDPWTVRRINTLKSEAKQAFQAGDYKTAAEKYKYLTDSLHVNEDEILLNLANAYYLLKDTANAFSTYQSVVQSSKNNIASRANNQLGLLTHQRGKHEEALSYFKQAIKADPENDDARYNYEMLKKKLDQKKKEDNKNNKDKNKDQNKKEPSAFAKQLKAQADRLVAERKYKAAYDLMMDGLKKDETVSHYQTFIERTKDVADINQ